MPLIFKEKRMFEHLVGSTLSFRLVEVVHVQLPDKGREIVVLEILRENLVPE